MDSIEVTAAVYVQIGARDGDFRVVVEMMDAGKLIMAPEDAADFRDRLTRALNAIDPAFAPPAGETPDLSQNAR